MDDMKYMQRAIELAKLGMGTVEPNPQVGSVIVRDGEIIGEGFHEFFGGPHAETNALADADRRGNDVRGATIYISLEPCCHFGKTPPCTEAILLAGLQRVVVAMKDPDGQVAGKGIDRIRESGIEVVEGVCQQQVQHLLAHYIKLRTSRRPWVICKWAQTADGYLGFPDARRWVSCDLSRQKVHELRSICDGIAVGINTVLTDDPQLTNRSGEGKQPVRVVLDTNLRIQDDCRLVQSAGESPVIVFTHTLSEKMSARAEDLRGSGIEIVEIPYGPIPVDLESMLDEMGRRRWTRLMVEGGSSVLKSFVKSGLADELHVYMSPETVGDNHDLPKFDINELVGRDDLTETARESVGIDTLRVYKKSE